MDLKIINLFQKYVTGQCNAAELEEVFAIMANGKYEAEWQQVIADEADHILSSGEESVLSREEVNAMYAGIAAKLPSGKRKKYRLWPRIVAVAAMLTLTLLGIYFFVYKEQQANNLSLVSNDLNPGSFGATLTLANGKKIKLGTAKTGKLTEEGGIVITKSASGQLLYEVTGSSNTNGQYNTLSTDKGETYQVRLPDGSLVWLNAASSLTYAVGQQQKSRLVKLAGEGYFEVAKDKNRPFIVESKNHRVEVLGTHFNLNAYADEPSITTTLLEGSVKVTAANKATVIKPGQQAQFDGNTIQVTMAGPEGITDWKDGDFYMNRMNFKKAMREIARWYDVEIIYDPSFPDDVESGGWISRNHKLSAVLKLIESSEQAHFRIEGRKIYVSR